MGRRQRLVLTAALAAFCALGAGRAVGGVLDQLERLGGNGSAREFLPPDEAFRLTDGVAANGDLVLDFDIEPGYYLYRERFAFSSDAAAAVLGEPRLPPSEAKDDPEFGRVEVYKHDMRVAVPVREAPPGGVGTASKPGVSTTPPPPW